MKSRIFTIRTLVLIMGLCTIGTNPVLATGDEEIIVNDVPISRTRLEQRTRLLNLIDKKPHAQARTAARKELIDEVLFAEIRRRTNVTVSDDDVKKAYASVAKRVGLSSHGLSGALRQSGIQPQTLKNRLRARIGMRRIKAALRRLEEAIAERDIPIVLEQQRSRPLTIKGSGSYHWNLVGSQSQNM